MRAGVREAMVFFYTYVLRCSDGELYGGHAADLKWRLTEHQSGKVQATAYRLPVELLYYEACRERALAQSRERQLKTGLEELT
jgi:putative endonuclease